MSDKFRKTIPLRITLSDGEMPTARKLTAIAEQTRNGNALLEKAIGDPWTQSGDSIYTNWPLQIPNLARSMGQNKLLNPAIFPASGQYTYQDEVGNRFLGKNEGDLLFATDAVSSISNLGGSVFGTRVSNEYDVTASGEYWVDSTTGRFKTFLTLTASDAISYTVDPTTWTLDDRTLPGVIPDPRQDGHFTSCRISSSAGKYYIHLPPRMPLTLDSVDSPYRYPVSGVAGVVDNMDSTVGSPPKYYQHTTSGLDGAGANFYRYSLPRELTAVWAGLSEGDKIPEGSIQLFDGATGTIVEDAVFYRASTSSGDWIMEVASANFTLSGLVTTTDEETNYNSNLYVLTNGSPVSNNIQTLWSSMLTHDHSNSGVLDKPISHNDLLNQNPPTSAYTAHSSRYPTYLNQWAPSQWSNDPHISLLNRAGSQETSARVRDNNNNAMLGHLVMANSAEVDTTSGIFLSSGFENDSFRICFGDVDGPSIYAVSGVGITISGMADQVGLTVSGVGTNAAAIKGTGLGTGTGVLGYGSVGVKGTGLSAGDIGVQGFGFGDGNGVEGYASTSGYGVAGFSSTNEDSYGIYGLGADSATNARAGGYLKGGVSSGSSTGGLALLANGGNCTSSGNGGLGIETEGGSASGVGNGGVGIKATGGDGTIDAVGGEFIGGTNRASINLTPKGEPTDYAAGDIYVDENTHSLGVHDGTQFLYPIRNLFTAKTSTLLKGAATAITKVTLATLLYDHIRIGTTIRVRVMGEYTGHTGAALTHSIRLNEGVSGDVVSLTSSSHNSNTGKRVYLDAEITFRSLGSASLYGSGLISTQYTTTNTLELAEQSSALNLSGLPDVDIIYDIGGLASGDIFYIRTCTIDIGNEPL